MLITIDTALIPQQSFNVVAQKNQTNRLARRCPVPDPTWLSNLVANGCSLQLEDVVVQAGRHFSDRVNQQAFTPSAAARQAATAIAWTIISLVSPDVRSQQLVVDDPLDGDIKRLCSEIFGVGFALEVLRKKRVIDGRTIRKVAGTFDFEANGRGGLGRIGIEAKGTFENASTSDHRTSIYDKIVSAGLPRGYDQAIGVIASLWTASSVRDFDIEICDPNKEPESHFQETVREIIRFYARRFDEAVGLPKGTKALFAAADNPDLFDRTKQSALPEAIVDPRRRISDLYHNRLLLRRGDMEQEYWGNFWERRKLPIPLHLDNVRDFGAIKAFMGIDSAIFQLIHERDFEKLVSYESKDEGLWYASGDTFHAVFSVDSYGVVRGLVDGDLPMNVETERH